MKPSQRRPATRYYRNRLWEVSWTIVDLGGGRVRIVKHYERRAAIGQSWKHVRGSVFERAA